MRKAILALSLCSIILSGCGAKGNDTAPEPVHEQYMTTGRYYTEGSVITNDGNIWGYQTEIISDKPAYDNEPVYVVFDDNGTGTDIYDDVILGLIFDVNTAIYDALETELSNSFELEREGNNIRIITQKGN